MVLRRCVVLKIFWVVWMKRNKIFFQGARERILIICEMELESGHPCGLFFRILGLVFSCYLLCWRWVYFLMSDVQGTPCPLCYNFHFLSNESLCFI